jgi:acyl-homoserine-lactone acylase
MLALAIVSLVCVSSVSARTPAERRNDVARWQAEARNVTITRDHWGIAHVHGKTDADAVFGMEYAQAEDDFNRVETNYINALGRLAETEGESAVYRDLRMKLFIRPAEMQARYAASPEWLRLLMKAFADGLNFYLYSHPEVKPRVITRFEPWMALAFTEGSIGGDIEHVNLERLASFYGDGGTLPPIASTPDGAPMPEPSGSNGIAIAPSKTLDHHALLWINPHTSFYFRSELQMASDEGLDAYGAVTWGQFFVYQGFNRTAGWMHTSSGVQNVDEFLETVTDRDGRYYYRYGDKEIPLLTRTIVVPYKTSAGMAHQTFVAYYTQHGPVIASTNTPAGASTPAARHSGSRRGDLSVAMQAAASCRAPRTCRWISISLMQRPMRALTQDFTRMKAADYKAFRQTMQLHTNSSNNTIFADAEGNIAYWHSDYIPRRSDAFDWSKPVDGSDPATAYHGLLSLDETPHLLDPQNGWLYNSNNWPWSAAGPYSPKRQDFPRYVENGNEESPRGYHALRLLTPGRNWTVASLTAAAFDSYLPAFARLIPKLLNAYDGLPQSDPQKAKLAPEITVLRAWNYRWGINTAATSLAIFWGNDIYRRVMRRARAAAMSPERYVVERATPTEVVQSLAAASNELTADFGTWQMPWGDINRFQRLDDSIASPQFDDGKPSIAVPFTSSIWGSLAAFGSRPYPNTKRWYGSYGNSFVAVVEFGPEVRAWAVTAGGESGHADSPHFDDEAANYANGNLRSVYFHRAQLAGHTERTYHPGD